jgi:hypothetical protein
VRTRVASSDWCASRKVERAPFVLHPLRELRSAERQQPVPATAREFAAAKNGNGRFDACRGGRPAEDFGIAVDDRLADESEDARRAVAIAAHVDEPRMLVEKVGRLNAGLKVRLLEECIQERHVRRDASDAKLPQRAQHARARFLEGRSPNGHLLEKRIVERRHDGAGIRGTTVEPHAEARCRPVRRDLAVRRRKLLQRIFGRDAALHRVAAWSDAVLERHAALGRSDRDPLGDTDLRLDEIDPRYHLGDRVLDLDTRIDFYEVILLRVDVDEELDGTGVVVVDRRRKRQSGLRHTAREFRREIAGRSLFEYFLVPSLDRTVTFAELYYRAVRVAENLDFDVARARHVHIDVQIVATESGFGFLARGRQELAHLLSALQYAHAATAAAPARLEHDGETDLIRKRDRSLEIGRKRAARGYDGNAGLLGERTCGYFIAEATHRRRRGTDEQNSGRADGIGEIGIFGEKAVARMNRVDTGVERDSNDIVDVEVGLHGRAAGSDEIALVRLEAMQREAIFM